MYKKYDKRHHTTQKMKNLTIITLFLIIWSPAFASEAPSLEVECDQMVKDNSNHDLAYEM